MCVKIARNSAHSCPHKFLLCFVYEKFPTTTQKYAAIIFTLKLIYDAPRHTHMPDTTHTHTHTHTPNTPNIQHSTNLEAICVGSHIRQTGSGWPNKPTNGIGLQQQRAPSCHKSFPVATSSLSEDSLAGAEAGAGALAAAQFLPIPTWLCTFFGARTSRVPSTDVIGDQSQLLHSKKKKNMFSLQNVFSDNSNIMHPMLFGL